MASAVGHKIKQRPAEIAYFFLNKRGRTTMAQKIQPPKDEIQPL